MGKGKLYTKNGKSILNPTDAHRKEQRKRDLKKYARDRKRNREFQDLKGDPKKLQEEIKVLKAKGPNLKDAQKLRKAQLEELWRQVQLEQQRAEAKAKQAAEEPEIVVEAVPQPKAEEMDEDEDEDEGEESEEEDDDDLDEDIVPPPPGLPPGMVAPPMGYPPGVVPPPPGAPPMQFMFPGMPGMPGVPVMPGVPGYMVAPPPGLPPPAAYPQPPPSAVPLPAGPAPGEAQAPAPPGTEPPAAPTEEPAAADNVVAAAPAITIPAPKQAPEPEIKKEPVYRPNHALMMSMVPASVLKMKAQKAAEAQHPQQVGARLSKAHLLATPKESKLLASMQAPAITPAAAPARNTTRPGGLMRRTINAAPDVDLAGTPSTASASTQPLQQTHRPMSRLFDPYASTISITQSQSALAAPVSAPIPPPAPVAAPPTASKAEEDVFASFMAEMSQY